MAYNSKSATEDGFELTREEFKQLKEAFKEEKFRNLLNEYVEEVNDPKNKELFQKEVTQFERERGVDVTFINPSPGYVIKSSTDGKRKAFINICSNDHVSKPSSAVTSQDGSPGLNWTIPYLLGQTREDLDNKHELCAVYDVVFHPDTLYLAKKNSQISKLVNDIALSAVEDNYSVKLDRKNIIFPKKQYKGTPIATVVRKLREDCVNEDGQDIDSLPGCPYPYKLPPKETTPKVTKPRVDSKDVSPYTTPTYLLKQKKEFEMQDFTYSPDAKCNSLIPTDIVVEIDLPLIKSATDISLDVADKSLSLISEKPAKYKLKVNLPYAVDDDQGNAKFDKSKKKLIITLPVKKCKFNPPEFSREDSGIESDVNQNNGSSSEEDIRKNVELLNVNGEKLEEYSENSNIFRTSAEVKTQFFDPDCFYSFPANSVTLKVNLVSISLLVNNIDPQSIAHQFVCEDEGVCVKFTSLGTGFFPIHYGFCLRIPGIILDKSSLIIEVWDNCLAANCKVIGHTDQIIKFFVGSALDSMHEKLFRSSEESLPAPEKGNFEDTSQEHHGVLENFILPPMCSDPKNPDITEHKIEADESQNLHEDKPSANVTSKTLDKPLEIAFYKNRTVSESSDLPESFGVGRRSILKGTRSLSESHTDEYNTWSSLDSESHEDLVTIKKTVRFNDVVFKKIFRANSSILGQRKKNEKKARNRKKAAHERLISIGSEESETDREEFDSVSELSDLSSDDSSGSTSASAATTVPSSKKHRRRGAKNQRKAAATAKHSHFAD